jgi:hypothetical protein
MPPATTRHSTRIEIFIAFMSTEVFATDASRALQAAAAERRRGRDRIADATGQPTMPATHGICLPA